MENRSDLNSILPFLPLSIRASSLSWSERAEDSLKALSLGPTVSHVDSGEVLFDFILDLRDSLDLYSQPPLASRAQHGFSLFFDEFMSRMDARVWFNEVIPALAKLLLKLPSLLECHYCKSNELSGKRFSGLRILSSQDAGILFLTQELIAALLACALFCLFPTKDRNANDLPIINFDPLFATLLSDSKHCQENKVKCLVHYFERICKDTPNGLVSFERKVLPFKQSSCSVSYPEADYWSKSDSSLCPFMVVNSGFIEDQKYEALEVDFANEYLGGGALLRGCVQEEIRFMINPELIIGMLFMPRMENNEAIEIIGVERFSKYMGYASSFRFVGDYVDTKPFDKMRRRKTRILAIDALYSPRMAQYEVRCLLREANKAFCGFLEHSNYQSSDQNCQESSGTHSSSENSCSNNCNSEYGHEKHEDMEIDEDKVGISTGNWGCGAFGGDPEIKSMIQWLAASQANRPFIHYYMFEEPSLEQLKQVTEWIMDHEWTVGDLWQMLAEYASQRLARETKAGFLSWLVPHLNNANCSNSLMRMICMSQ
ncbi:poly(ADP-ribose) glycohydrolase 1-like protein [Carex littledalei]|uniref:poly(ADP-ribose) glycohydrolase n=1 Tax=Carex littledalei TaxID=544730 RepID=A0A833RKV7_9POAL|nr:poly(ADP-ribose) glycohydrolase 1-like protein [Carex littledalei]